MEDVRLLLVPVTRNIPVSMAVLNTASTARPHTDKSLPYWLAVHVALSLWHTVVIGAVGVT